MLQEVKIRLYSFIHLQHKLLLQKVYSPSTSYIVYIWILQPEEVFWYIFYFDYNYHTTTVSMSITIWYLSTYKIHIDFSFLRIQPTKIQNNEFNLCRSFPIKTEMDPMSGCHLLLVIFQFILTVILVKRQMLRKESNYL